jgi:hypothetical protein
VEGGRRFCYDAGVLLGGPTVSTTTADLPSITSLTAEQKARLLALLIKDELDRQPIPMLITVNLDGDDLGHFRPKIKSPAKTTPLQLTDAEREDLVRLARDPGKTFTLEELLALEASGTDESLLR